jgi:SAM-dependent methyltransferase
MIDRAMPNRSGFSSVDQASDPMAYVRRLDGIGAHEFWRTVKYRTFTLLDVHESDCLLDVGCGTGDDALALGRMVGQTGRVTGVDNSATMIAEARTRVEGTGLPVTFYKGDASGLDFPDESFDGCRAERVLQHLDDPHRAVAEMARVARSGACIVIVEPDYGSLMVDGADPAVTRKILNQRCAHFRSGKVGRRLPGMCARMGLTGIGVALVTLASTDIAQAAERHQLDKYVFEAHAAGVVSATEGAAWLADLEAAGAAGRYRHATTIFLVSGRKP